MASNRACSASLFACHASSCLPVTDGQCVCNTRAWRRLSAGGHCSCQSGVESQPCWHRAQHLQTHEPAAPCPAAAAGAGRPLPPPPAARRPAVPAPLPAATPGVPPAGSAAPACARERTSTSPVSYAGCGRWTWHCRPVVHGVCRSPHADASLTCSMTCCLPMSALMSAKSFRACSSTASAVSARCRQHHACCRASTAWLQDCRGSVEQ
jgi:hypothetical protein